MRYRAMYEYHPVDRADPDGLPYYRKKKWKAVAKEAYEVNAGIVATAIFIAGTMTGPITSPKWILIERVLAFVMISIVVGVLVVQIGKLLRARPGYDRVDAWTGLFQGLAWTVPMCIAEMVLLIFYTRSGTPPLR